jgi:N-acetylmuramoyl-L-alanine amidase
MRTIALDPGHGGQRDVGSSSAIGACSPAGVEEKVVTLALANRIRARLEPAVCVVLTRERDVNRSLADRAAVAACADAFVSLHAAAGPGASGAETWIHADASDPARALARALAQSLGAVGPMRSVRNGRLAVLDPEHVGRERAACLVELGWLPERGASLNRIAGAIAGGIRRYLDAAPRFGRGLPWRDEIAVAGSLAARRYGVDGGVVMDSFYRDVAEKQQLTGRGQGRNKHYGLDVSLSSGSGGDVNDPRRGAPVYAAIRTSILIDELNAVRGVDAKGNPVDGLSIAGSGTASLRDAVVLAQPWIGSHDYDYGGVVGLACRYTFNGSNGAPGLFTLYVEYLHLITEQCPPKNGQGEPIGLDVYQATGKGLGFGPRIKNGAVLSPSDLGASSSVLIGFLGATETPHVHINVNFATGVKKYLLFPRIDPTIVVA